MSLSEALSVTAEPSCLFVPTCVKIALGWESSPLVDTQTQRPLVAALTEVCH